MKRTIPPEALRLDIRQPITFLQQDVDPPPEGEAAPKETAMRFRMEPLVSGKVVPNHWYWGNLAIDLAGIEIPERPIGALLQHDQNARVGAVDHMEVVKGVGLVAEGRFLKSRSATEVLDDAADGFPWQASAHVIPNEIEELAPGSSAEVNGLTVEGPGAIFRRSRIGEASFVAVGADPDTQARAISARQEGLAMAEPQQQNMNTTAAEPNALELTADLIQRDHPEVAATLAASGATTERRRVVDILDFADPGQAELALQLIRDGVEATVAQRQLNQELRDRLSRSTEPAAGPVERPQNGSLPIDNNDTSDEGLKARWAGDAGLRSEFVSYEIFAAYARAEARGRIRIAGKVRD